jgi:hypothetical protein
MGELGSPVEAGVVSVGDRAAELLDKHGFLVTALGNARGARTYTLNPGCNLDEVELGPRAAKRRDTYANIVDDGLVATCATFADYLQQVEGIA